MSTFTAKLDEPVALSVKLVSVSGVVKLSVIVKPTLAVTDLEFVDNTIFVLHLTNCPLT